MGDAPAAGAGDDEAGQCLLQRVRELLRLAHRLDYFARAPEDATLSTRPSPGARAAAALRLEEGTLGIAWPCVPQLHTVASRAFAQARQQAADDDAADAAAALLLVAPFHYSAWAARKRALLRAAAAGDEYDAGDGGSGEGGTAGGGGGTDDGSASDRFLAALTSEQRLARMVVTRHPKSGEGWAHRRWLVSAAAERFQQRLRHGGGGGGGARLVPPLLGELSDCAVAAERRPRNYHAWTHRLHVLHALVRMLAQAAAACPPAHTTTTTTSAAAAAASSSPGALVAAACMRALPSDSSDGGCGSGDTPGIDCNDDSGGGGSGGSGGPAAPWGALTRLLSAELASTRLRATALHDYSAMHYRAQALQAAGGALGAAVVCCGGGGGGGGGSDDEVARAAASAAVARLAGEELQLALALQRGEPACVGARYHAHAARRVLQLLSPG